MSIINLLKPYLDGGLRTNNFFNGRLLTGEDLSTEQAADREGRRRLGTAMGEGVAYGLQVEISSTLGENTPTTPVVMVHSGLAINRQGQLLTLSDNVDVRLVRPANGGTETESSAIGGMFATCLPPQTGAYVAGEGVYLLTIAPAFGSEGRAQVSGLGNTEAACNRKYLLEGVQFRLIQLDLTAAELSDRNRLRNHVAYKCFGLEDPRWHSLITNPFDSSGDQYGMLDDLRPNRLTDCDVPLALLYWTAANGIEFVDMWAVRRRLTGPSLSDSWNGLAGDRRQSEAEAMLLQFENQVEDIQTAEANLDTIVSSQRFDYLPPAGILPIQTTGDSSRFNYQAFFKGQAYHSPIIVDGVQLWPLISDALRYAPINLQTRDPVRLYQIADGTTILPYLVFANAHAPARGDARFDIVRWNYTSFSR